MPPCSNLREERNATLNRPRPLPPLYSELGAWLSVLVGGKKEAAPVAAAAAVVPATDPTAALAGSRSVSCLLPMHGPVVSSAVAQLTREYRAWTEAQVKAASTACAVVLYASAYGNTAALAQVRMRWGGV